MSTQRKEQMLGRFEWERELRIADLPWHVKSVLLMVGTYMSADGSNARPSASALARNTGLSRSRVFAVLRAAEDAGWIASVGTPGKRTIRIPVLPTGRVSPTGPVLPTRREGSYPQDPTRPTHRTRQSQDNLKTTHPPRAGGVASLAAAARATEEEIDQLAEKIKTERTDVRSPLAFLRACHDNGDLGAMLAGIRSERQRAGIATELTEARANRALRCEHGMDGGIHRRSDTGRLVCPQCRSQNGAQPQ